MGFGVNEVEYEPGIRERNRLLIAVLTLGAMAVTLLVPTYTDWPFANAIAIACIVLGFGLCLYWMFASKKAGRLQVSTSWNRWRKNMNM